MRSALFCVLAACGTTPPADDTVVDCSTVTNADTFVVGLEKKGAQGSLDFKLMSATPAPPLRGDNSWVLELDALSGSAMGAPVTGATMTVSPYMPSHGHYSPFDVQVTPMMVAGQYQLDPVNFSMPGVWETTIRVTGSTTDTAMYLFCIPE